MAEITLTLAEALKRALALQQAGDRAQAEQIYRKIIGAKPDHFQALHLLGVLRHRCGDDEEADRLLRQAIALRPDFADAHYNRGNALKGLKRFDEALASYDKAIALKPDYADAYNNRGNALKGLKRFDEALVSYDKAIALEPGMAEAYNNRGNALTDLERLDEALASYDQAIALKPDYAEARHNRGNALLALKDLKRLDDVLASYDKAIALKPDYAEAHYNRGNVLAALKRFDEALASYDKAITLQPDYAQAYNHRANALAALKRFEQALGSYDKTLALLPDDAQTYNNRGSALVELQRYDEALASYDKAIALNPDHARAYNNRANVLKELGQFDKAKQACLEALRLDPKIGDVYLNLAELKTFAPGDPHLAAMESLAAQTEGLSETDRMQLDFALGKAYADVKDYRASFKRLLAGNAAKRAAISYDEKSAFAIFDRIEAVFTRRLIVTKSGSGDSSPMPIFVLGMPRSGTTLVEQIIASHPTVFGGGELHTLLDVICTVRGPVGNTIRFPDFVPTLDVDGYLDPAILKLIGGRYIAAVRKFAPTAERVTNKLPLNFHLAGLIHLALPNAKIVHTVRDPVDNCVACFAKLFAGDYNHTYDLAELGRYYRRYERLMAHWRRVLPRGRILDVCYEDVVADLDGQARRIISHCGLPWDDRCLSFHKTDRPVRTASATQVRQPIYNSAVGRWRVYAEEIEPLLNALNIATPGKA